MRGAFALALLTAQLGCRQPFESSTAIKSFERGATEKITLWGQPDLMHPSHHYCRVEVHKPWHFTSELILSTIDSDGKPPGSPPHSEQYAGCRDRLLKVGRDLQSVSRLQIVREPRDGGRVRVDLHKDHSGNLECSATAAKPGRESEAEIFVEGVKGGRGNYQGCEDLIGVQEDLLVTEGTTTDSFVGARGIAYLKWPGTAETWTTYRLADDPSAASFLQWVSSVDPSSDVAITGYRATHASSQQDVTFYAIDPYKKWPWRLYATALPEGGCRFNRSKTLAVNDPWPKAAPKSGHSMEFQYLEYAPGVMNPAAPGRPGISKRVASGRLHLRGSESKELPALERAPRLEVSLAAEYPDPLGPPWFKAKVGTPDSQDPSNWLWRLDRWECPWVSPASGDAPMRALWVKISSAN